MKKNAKAVLDDCLMKLPSEYLTSVEYSEGHDELSEFNIRVKYVNQRKN